MKEGRNILYLSAAHGGAEEGASAFRGRIGYPRLPCSPFQDDYKVKILMLFFVFPLGVARQDSQHLSEKQLTLPTREGWPDDGW